MPNGKSKPVSFKQAEKIFAGDFPISNEYNPDKQLAPVTTDSEIFDDDESDGNGEDGIESAPRFNP